MCHSREGGNPCCGSQNAYLAFAGMTSSMKLRSPHANTNSRVTTIPFRISPFIFPAISIVPEAASSLPCGMVYPESRTGIGRQADALKTF